MKTNIFIETLAPSPGRVRGLQSTLPGHNHFTLDRHAGIVLLLRLLILSILLLDLHDSENISSIVNLQDTWRQLAESSVK